MKANYIKSFSTLSLLVCMCAFTGSARADIQLAWEKFRAGEAVILIRHALAPGNGDPANFSVTDCTTQRNLSDEGREQSVRMGKVIKTQGADKVSVFSSQWCRCIDTASGFDFGAPQPLPILNSFYQDRSTANEQTTALKNWIAERLSKPVTNSQNKPLENTDAAPILPAVLVTHQVNITALTNVFPSSGEMVFVGINQGDIEVFGSLETR